MKYILALIVLTMIGVGVYALSQERMAPASQDSVESANSLPEGASVVTDGVYSVIPGESRVEWAGKKPLLDGYINTGSIAVSTGVITVAQKVATAEFTMDMDTLSVSATPTKPGQENALEGHLKGERWFNVAAHPTATFAITKVAERADSGETFVYDITGDLTLKGQTHQVTFPATIYQTSDGRVRAAGSFEIDRTQWGITSGSASFFDNLADNAIDDIVALSFSLVAATQ
ncbi:MAG TPA: YceI family protein [Candidatus Paceibacterota bacterium]|nr:YceI family protein [Candidatus Paceibacterota bacterium]